MVKSTLTKETLMPIGLVISIALLAYDIGKSSNKLDTIENRVHAIEVDRGEKIHDYIAFQKEIIERLTRIESEVASAERSKK